LGLVLSNWSVGWWVGCLAGLVFRLVACCCGKDPRNYLTPSSSKDGDDDDDDDNKDDNDDDDDDDDAVASLRSGPEAWSSGSDFGGQA
jgi:hypothetical protein